MTNENGTARAVVSPFARRRASALALLGATYAMAQGVPGDGAAAAGAGGEDKGGGAAGAGAAGAAGGGAAGAGAAGASGDGKGGAAAGAAGAGAAGSQAASGDGKGGAAGAAAGAAGAAQVDTTGDDDDPKPDDKGWVTMPYNKFVKRLARLSDAKLKETFGTADREVIIKEREEYKALKDADEKRKRDAMSEQQKLEADKKKAEDEAAATRKELEDERRQLAVERQDDVLKGIAADAVNPKYVKHALRDLRDHVKNELTDAQVEAMTEAKIKEWFGTWAKENPEMAKTAPADPAAAAGAAGAKKAPITTGSGPGNRPGQPSSGVPAGKTARPGQPNSMTPAEFAAFKRSKGISS